MGDNLYKIKTCICSKQEIKFSHKISLENVLHLAFFAKNLFDTCSVRLPVRYLLHQYLTKFSPTFVLEQENMVYRIKQIQLAEGVRHYLTKCAFTSVLKQEVKAAKMPPVFLTLSFVLSK